MKVVPISINEAKQLKLQLITYFRTKFAVDSNISKKKNINIGTKEKPKIVDCDIVKSQRHYNHFEWIEKLQKEINDDPDREAYVVMNIKGERALGVNSI